MPADKDTNTAWVSLGAHLTLSVEWAEHIEQVVVTGKEGYTSPFAIHLSPSAARDLAGQLVAAAETAGDIKAVQS
jgi:hypothetical protein